MPPATTGIATAFAAAAALPAPLPDPPAAPPPAVVDAPAPPAPFLAAVAVAGGLRNTATGVPFATVPPFGI